MDWLLWKMRSKGICPGTGHSSVVSQGFLRPKQLCLESQLGIPAPKRVWILMGHRVPCWGAKANSQGPSTSILGSKCAFSSKSYPLLRLLLLAQGPGQCSASSQTGVGSIALEDGGLLASTLQLWHSVDRWSQCHQEQSFLLWVPDVLLCLMSQVGTAV